VRVPGSVDAKPGRRFAATDRRSCVAKGCFATFDASAADEGTVRHCNRAGPDGGHALRWDGRAWQALEGLMQHDRS
jgi:hypothetical protein